MREKFKKYKDLMRKTKIKELNRLAIIVYIPVRFQRIMTSFTETINKGRVIWRLSIISDISPHIRTRAHRRGMIERKVIMKTVAMRRSDIKLSIVASSVSRHKPVNLKPNRFSSTAHTKSSIKSFDIKIFENIWNSNLSRKLGARRIFSIQSSYLKSIS